MAWKVRDPKPLNPQPLRGLGVEVFSAVFLGFRV